MVQLSCSFCDSDSFVLEKHCSCFFQLLIAGYTDRCPERSASVTFVQPSFTCVHFSQKKHTPHNEHTNVCQCQHPPHLLPHKKLLQISILPWCKLKVVQPCSQLKSNSHSARKVEINTLHNHLVLPTLKSLHHTNNHRKKCETF
jgi:hypothetical protein